jgi:LysM repeat protein
MRRSPARFLAPLALVAFAFALYSVVQDARDTAGPNTSEITATPTSDRDASSGTDKAATDGDGGKQRKGPKTYTVKSGDTLSGIAEKTDVSLETLTDLNPDADTLSPGQKLKLRK